jgi:hypothetical protein
MGYSDSRFEVWNRKLHYYVGLYLLLFVWVFSVSGLIINHPGWTFASTFWDTRKQEKYQKHLQPVSGATDLERARGILAQLGIAGEIDWPGRQQPDHLAIRAGRPGRLYEVDAHMASGTATVNRTTVNGWGALRMLHTFTGVRANDPASRRDWIMTSIWSASMDAVAIGLAFLVGSGIWVWLRSGRRWIGCLLSLAVGVAVCVYFLAA